MREPMSAEERAYRLGQLSAGLLAPIGVQQWAADEIKTLAARVAGAVAAWGDLFERRVEAAARALCEHDGFVPDERTWGGEPHWRAYRNRARKALLASDAVEGVAVVPAEATRKLVYEAIRFANWAVGEGICPNADQPTRDPEDFLMDYSVATGDEDWETLAERVSLAASREPRT